MAMRTVGLCKNAFCWPTTLYGLMRSAPVDEEYKSEHNNVTGNDNKQEQSLLVHAISLVAAAHSLTTPASGDIRCNPPRFVLSKRLSLHGLCHGGPGVEVRKGLSIGITHHVASRHLFGLPFGDKADVRNCGGNIR